MKVPQETISKASAAIDKATADHAGKLGIDLSGPPPAKEPEEPSPVRSLGLAHHSKIQWIWRNYIPRGMLTLVSASGGTGKSTCAALIAATLSVGAALPGQEPLEPMSSLIISDEEHEDEVLEHVEKAHGNPSIIDCVDESRTSNIDLSQNWNRFVRCVDDSPDSQLVIIDPISAFLGRNININDVGVMRPLLSRLSTFARQRNIGILICAHTNKSSQMADANAKTAGSSVLIDRPRSVLHLIRDGQDQDVRILVPGKSNKGRMPDSIAFRITDDAVTWENFRPDITLQTLERAAQKRMSVSQYLGNEVVAVDEGLCEAIFTLVGDDWERYTYRDLTDQFGPNIFGTSKPATALTRIIGRLHDDYGVDMEVTSFKIDHKPYRGIRIRRTPENHQLDQMEI